MKGMSEVTEGANVQLGRTDWGSRKTRGEVYDAPIAEPSHSLCGVVSGVGEYMGDEPLEEKKPPQPRRLRSLFGVLVGMLIGQCIVINWHRFHDHGFIGFKAVRWDDFFVRALGVIGLTICFCLLDQDTEITTLGIGGLKAKKLR